MSDAVIGLVRARWPELYLRGLALARGAYDGVRALQPARRDAARRNAAARRGGLARLDAFSRETPIGPPAARRVLVDGTWDNANYWSRFALARRALGLAAPGVHEVGLLGEHQRRRVREAFASFGVREEIDLAAATARRGEHRRHAAALVAATRSPDDILRWRLPLDLPAELVYDGILKRQRRAAVDLDDPLLPVYVAEALAWLDAAETILDAGRFDLLLMSHAIDYSRGALVWAALKRGIPVIALYGDYGTLRLVRLSAPDDVFAYPGRPTREEMDAMPGPAREGLRATGERYMRSRLAGATHDVSAIYAFARRTERASRARLCAESGWDPAAPAIGVYASNWYDYPHTFGRFPFRDFLDWARATIEAARRAGHVNFLFKAHPCDEWYGAINGERLADLVAAADAPNIRLAATDWNSADLLEALDGIVTCHGTVAIEAASIGKPVLVAYPGWYGRLGFTATPDSREGYLARLGDGWWRQGDPAARAARAQLFAGWYFGSPAWHGDYAWRDDAEQDAIFWDLPSFLDQHAGALRREAETMRAWHDSGHRFYQVFKMIRADAFAAVTRRADAAADPRQRALLLPTAETA